MPARSKPMLLYSYLAPLLGVTPLTFWTSVRPPLCGLPSYFILGGSTPKKILDKIELMVALVP